ncbi:MAG TPA: glutathione S-transferase family protein [Plasticicumulans sp.]|nr:glutathione S-transferase family protein [Plasticicumulans sp.]
MSLPELVSFPLCPFVQRAVIVLREKQVPFTIRYIDLDNPPDWFLALSPLGKVPLLQVGDTVLFESAVIAEYLDETHPPALMPADPLARAQARAWIEFASNLLGRQYRMLVAKDQAGFDEEFAAAHRELAFVERAHADGPMFLGGDTLSLVDAGFAPFFMRFELMNRARPLALLDDYPKLRRWAAALADRDSVRRSVPEDFNDGFRRRFAGGWFGTAFADTAAMH